MVGLVNAITMAVLERTREIGEAVGLAMTFVFPATYVGIPGIAARANPAGRSSVRRVPSKAGYWVAAVVTAIALPAAGPAPPAVSRSSTARAAAAPLGVDSASA